jgi:predicted nucleic acid-binding protein
LKPLVFNSTPLIYLSKAGLSGIIENLPEEKMTSPLVRAEVVDKGKQKGVPDAFALEKLFERSVFKLGKPKDELFLSRLSQTRGLHAADAEVLALAKENGGLAVVDDEVARKTAKVYKINYVGTPYVLMRAVFEGCLSNDQAKAAVRDMVSLGWRCNVETYAQIMELIDKIVDAVDGI